MLYFAQYVVTYVDEEAREKALKRLDEESDTIERNQGSQKTKACEQTAIILDPSFQNCLDGKHIFRAGTPRK